MKNKICFPASQLEGNSELVSWTAHSSRRAGFFFVIPVFHIHVSITLVENFDMQVYKLHLATSHSWRFASIP